MITDCLRCERDRRADVFVDSFRFRRLVGRRFGSARLRWVTRALKSSEQIGDLVALESKDSPRAKKSAESEPSFWSGEYKLERAQRERERGRPPINYPFRAAACRQGERAGKQAKERRRAGESKEEEEEQNLQMKLTKSALSLSLSLVMLCCEKSASARRELIVFC